MSREEVIEHLGTIAKSGTREFFRSLTGDQQKDAHLIGQFGVGFYSSFIVADRVTVVTRRARLAADQGVRWESEGAGEFSIEMVDRPERGTEINLHLKEGQEDLLSGWKLREIIRKYSDHIVQPIVMKKEDWKDGEQVVTDEDETVNQASALWARPKSEISDEQYKAFYKHVGHDFEEPLAWLHARVEGRQDYTKAHYLVAHYDGTKHRLWVASATDQKVGAWEAPLETAPGLVTAAPATQQVGDYWERITGLEVYGEQETIVVLKQGSNWWMKTNDGAAYYPVRFQLRELTSVQDSRNGQAHLVHNAYLYFTVLDGLQRYISTSLDNVGPDKGNGLPDNRQGPIVSLAGDAGRFYAAIDGGLQNKSSIMVNSGEGWHTIWIAPQFGRPIRFIFIHSMEGDAVDRLWVGQTGQGRRGPQICGRKGEFFTCAQHGFHGEVCDLAAGNPQRIRVERPGSLRDGGCNRLQ